MKNENPIGLFDSGIGGTSIWKEVHALMPHENTIYLADSKNAPYGLKSKDEIIALSCKNTEFLLENNCKIIVVACNTATTNAIKELRAKYDVPFIGIEPAIKPAALHSKTQTIGILATKGTLNSELFYKNVEKFQDIKIIEHRNDLLHGNISLENDDKQTDENINLYMAYVSAKLFTLISKLILKSIGYDGYVYNNAKYIEKHLNISTEEEYFERI